MADSANENVKRRLTDPLLRSLTAPTVGQRIVWDTVVPRLGLRLAKGGARTWFVRYKLRGRSRWLTLGTSPLVSLADARAAAKVKLAKVSQGEDPAAERRHAAEAKTFGELADLYLQKYAIGPGGEAKPRKRSWREDKRILATYVPPTWRSTPARAITRHQVRDVIEQLASRASVMANRFRACLSKVFSFAVGRDLVPFNPVAGVERQRETPRTRSFNDAELKAIWHAIEAEDVATAALFKLALLLGARGGELRGLRWAELDLDGAVWNLPAERTKTNTARRIPLTRDAIELLRALPKAGAYVFPGRRGRGRTSLKDAQRRIATRAGVAGWTTHDLRAACGTGLALLGYHSDLIAAVLGQTTRGTTARHYIRTTRENEVRAALEAWSRKVFATVTGEPAAKVVPIRSA